jgi:hypothetical protein
MAHKTRKLGPIKYALTMVLIFVATSACKSDNSFSYSVRVQDKDSAQTVPNAKVIIEIAGIASLDDVTDVNGLARIFIDASHSGKPGRLTVEANGYKKYTQNIDLTKDGLPDVIQLESESNDSIATFPTGTPSPELPTATGTPVPPTNTPVSPTDTPTPTPTSVLDSLADISRFLAIEDLKYVGTYQSQEFVSIYRGEDWVTCPSETLSLDSIEGVAIRGEWMIPECGDRFETRVREDVNVLQNTHETERLFKTLVAEARKVPWFYTAYELATEYGSFWVVRSDYQNGTTATMVAEVDGGVVQLFIDSKAVIDEMNLNALILSAILRLRRFPLARGVLILLDTSLFPESVGQSLVIYPPISGMRRVYAPQPTIAQIMQKYGEPNKIVETELTYGLDALSDPIKLDAKVYYYGSYGFGSLVDQVIDKETLDYVKETYDAETYQTLTSPKKGEIIWVMAD